MSKQLNWVSAVKLAKGFAKKKYSAVDVAKALPGAGLCP